MSQFKTWIAPTVVTIVLAIFVVSSALFYSQVQDELRAKECAIVAKAIALNLVNEIKSIARVLNGLSQIESANTTNKIMIYEKISKNLIAKYPGFFYGINFINADGVIERIYPYEGNELALGRNLMERPELKPYLLESIKQKQAMMSHRVITYQGIYAIIIYEPLYDNQQKFKGWVNAVINIDVWLKEQLKNEDWKDIFIHMHWQGEDAYDLNIGPERPGQVFSYDFNVLNQKIKIEVGQIASSLNSLHTRLWYGLETLGVCLLLLTSFLMFRLTVSRKELLVANQQLNLKNILLNSLAHDISTPLTSLGLVVEQMVTRKDSTLPQTTKDRALKNLTILSDMLSSVRSLSRLQMHKEDLKTEPVSVKAAIDASISGVQDVATSKNVSFKMNLHEADPIVMAHESTFVNNVMPNVLSNAIKFSPVGGVITISSSFVSPCIIVSVEDEGGGFTEKEIEKFNSGKTLQSSLGTEGEVGSGLGLTQVKGFMELYNGQVTLENSAKGAAIKLRFRKAK